MPVATTRALGIDQRDLQRERERLQPRAPDRRHRRAHGRHHGARAAAARRTPRLRLHVRGRRHGHGDGGRGTLRAGRLARVRVALQSIDPELRLRGSRRASCSGRRMVLPPRSAARALFCVALTYRASSASSAGSIPSTRACGCACALTGHPARSGSSRVPRRSLPSRRRVQVRKPWSSSASCTRCSCEPATASSSPRTIASRWRRPTPLRSPMRRRAPLAEGARRRAGACAMTSSS